MPVRVGSSEGLGSILPVPARKVSLLNRVRAKAHKTSGHKPAIDMKHALFALLLVAQALAWAKLELTAANPFTNELVFVEWSTLRVIGRSVRVWILADWGEPDENGIRFIYGEHEYVCEEGRTRSLSLSFYSERFVTPVGNQLEPGEWTKPTPYSLGGVVLTAVCADR